ncbi:DNA cytosine methyltransferase [Flavobacterium sp. N2013]|nr:DNA cytosine methyltransferase [Flavobacterium sp. N2013]
MKKMIDLFAGCGGLSLGMEQAGFTTIFANEINQSLFETYLYNRNLSEDSYFTGDINELNQNIKEYKSKFTDVDLVCGGPPCQGFSMANRQRILDDPRNTLYKAFLEFLKEVKPKFFVMENVKGMSKKIDEIKNDFKEYLGEEYSFSHSLFNAKDFGLPQNRERFFIIGNRLGIDNDSIFDQIKNNKLKNPFVLKDAISDLPKLEPNRTKNNTQIENKEIGFFETEYSFPKSTYADFVNNGKKVNKLYNHKNRFNNDRDIEIFSLLPQGGNSLHKSIEHIMPYKSRNHIFKDKYFKLDENEVCKTITSHMKHDCNMYIHPNQARGLSPREAARIQTFPDYYVFKGTPNYWYAQIGNAVPVKLAEFIGKEIIKYL